VSKWLSDIRLMRSSQLYCQVIIVFLTAINIQTIILLLTIFPAVNADNHIYHGSMKRNDWQEQIKPTTEKISINYFS